MVCPFWFTVADLLLPVVFCTSDVRHVSLNHPPSTGRPRGGTVPLYQRADERARRRRGRRHGGGHDGAAAGGAGGAGAWAGVRPWAPRWGSARLEQLHWRVPVVC